MPARLAGWAALVLVTLLAAPVAADPPPPRSAYSVRPGDRVRLWTAGGGERLVGSVGTVNATDHAAMVVVVNKRAEVVPFASLERLDVSRGREYELTAAVIGAVVGVAAGLIVTEGDVIDSDLNDLERASIIVAAGVAGALGGRAIGRSIPEESWQPVDITPMRPQPMAPAGVGASFTLRF